MKSWQQPTNEMIEKALASVKTEVERQYFFSRLKNPLWIKPLVKCGYFESPPKVKHLPENLIQTPNWPELQYLKNVSIEAAQEVTGIIQGLPETDNPTVYRSIIDIALKLPVKYSIGLQSKIYESFECLNITTYLLSHNYLKLLKYWAEENQMSSALTLLKKLLEFKPDPEAKEKIKKKRLAERKFDNNMTVSEFLSQDDSTQKQQLKYLKIKLEPKPNFNEWEYSKILTKGVPLLIEIAPYDVACTLIDIVNQVFSLMYPYEINDDDPSYIWCPRVDHLCSGSPSQKEHLIFTLASVCEKVYQKNPDYIQKLDELLRRSRWSVFQRIRQYLYSLYPNEQTRTWIREEILKYKDYHQHEYDYELQKMIQSAAVHFGTDLTDLLIRNELTQVFEKILSGPSQENFKRWCELKQIDFTEDDFKKRKDYFQSMQFNPFKSVLFGKYKEIFQQLKAKNAKQISDEDYSPIPDLHVGYVSHYSPKSKEELAKLPDQELLNYINQWENESFDRETFKKINIDGLAKEFQIVFQEHIIQDVKRLNFWIENRDQIQRPIYIKAILKGQQISITDSIGQLEQWFDFCKWVLSHNDEDQKEDVTYSDESKENPSWQSSRRAVFEFIEDSIKKINKQNLNLEELKLQYIIDILKTLCTQFDKRLDKNMKTQKSVNDYYFEAVNSTKSRALEQLIQLGYYLREQNKKAFLEVLSFLEKERLKDNVKYPLTLPEYAILGFCYGGYYSNQEWMAKNKSQLFPQEQWEKWYVAFGMVLQKTPHSDILKVLKDDFVFAINKLNQIKSRDSDDRKGMVDDMGRHLWLYYLWDKYPLKKSLLERFYEKADKKHWKNLFELIGRQLKNHSNEFDENMKKRVIEFFDWRLKAKEPLELQEFSLWLEAACLDIKWRLEQYSKILDICQNRENSLDIWWHITILHKMLTDHTREVMVCFEKLTRPLISGVILPLEDTRAILEVGLKSKDKEILSNATLALDHLLKAGCFEFLDMENKS